MKNFILAILVFLIWGSASLYYLHASGSFQEYYSDEKIQNNFNFNNDVPAFTTTENTEDFITTSPLYPDNSLLSNEMENTVNFLKEQYGMNTEEHDEDDKDERIKNAHLLYPEFYYGKLIVNQNLINYSKELEKIVARNPAVKITIIGHFKDEETNLDNYFEGLKRAKQLKQYIIQNFKIADTNVSAISEGESRPLHGIIDANSTKNNRIEVLIKH